jgi:uncharacterized protein
MSVNARIEETGQEPTMLDTEPAPGAGTIPGDGALVDSARAQAPRAEPVSSAERYFTVDVVRGFALLGILAMNIVGFAWPFAAYENPMRGGGFTGLDRAVWFGNHLFFEDKMMSIFSMLFGAGLVLLDHRALARGARILGIYYRRVGWLLAIGLVHAYLIWMGDILVLYAQCGLLLYPFRKRRPITLIIAGICALLVLVPLRLVFAGWIDSSRAASARVAAAIQAGQVADEHDRRLNETWSNGAQEYVDPTPEQAAKSFADEVSVYRGGYAGIVKHRAPMVFFIQTFYAVLFGGIFFALGRMLLGMGLMKLGVFSGERSLRFYAWMVGIGYGLGLPLMVFDATQLIRHDFSVIYSMHGGSFYNLFGSLVVALGHVGALMLIVKSGALSWLTRRLAAVGRMALSNYLMHSLICTTLFYGYGFALFGQINRTGLVAIVVLIWAFQLLVSPIWLEHFRFGPAEWLWRSLTYWRLQPMRVATARKIPAMSS